MTLIEEKFRKVISDYHERLITLRNRTRLIEQVRNLLNQADFEKAISSSNFFDQLEPLLRLDGSLIRDMNKNYSWIRSELARAIGEYDDVLREMKKHEIADIRGKKINCDELDKLRHFLIDLLEFMNASHARLFTLEHRLNIERQLIMHRSPDVFYRYVSLWEQELKDEESIISLYDKVINRNQKIVLRPGDWKRAAAYAAGVGIAGMVLPGSIFMFAAAGTGLLTYYLHTKGFEDEELAKETALIRDLKKAKIIKTDPNFLHTHLESKNPIIGGILGQHKPKKK
ncbi:MAG: hypothetical protein AABX51_05895 [Nanoarchaeota archaeon]